MEEPLSPILPVLPTQPAVRLFCRYVFLDATCAAFFFLTLGYIERGMSIENARHTHGVST